MFIPAISKSFKRTPNVFNSVLLRAIENPGESKPKVATESTVGSYLITFYSGDSDFDSCVINTKDNSVAWQVFNVSASEYEKHSIRTPLEMRGWLIKESPFSTKYSQLKDSSMWLVV